MTVLNVSEPEGLLYIVADSHLDDQNDSAREFVEMLTKLENPHTVVFLGDLFKIWLAPPKYWTDLHRQVIFGIECLKKRCINVVFISGNREMLLPKKFTDIWKKKLPFTHLSLNDFFLNWGQKHYGFIHGDTLNYNDRKYLRWKAISHSRTVETIFHMMPGPVANWIAERIESMLVETNTEYKVHFPEKEIRQYAKNVLPKVDQFFVGHFHLDRKINVVGCSSELRIVPDWLSQKKVIRINPEGEIVVLRFQDCVLKKVH